MPDQLADELHPVAQHAKDQTRAGTSPFVFPSCRSRSGHVETVQKQFDLAKQLAGLPEVVVLCCARHRFSTDAMEGTGNMMAVIDVTGHSRVDVTRLYQHPGLKQIGVAINKRNEVAPEHKPSTKPSTEEELGSSEDER
jgi:site-specific recombinase XerC